MQSIQPGKKTDLEPFELQIPIDHFDLQSSDWITFGLEVTNNGSNGFVYVQLQIQIP